MKKQPFFKNKKVQCRMDDRASSVHLSRAPAAASSKAGVTSGRAGARRTAGGGPGVSASRGRARSARGRGRGGSRLARSRGRAGGAEPRASSAGAGSRPRPPVNNNRARRWGRGRDERAPAGVDVRDAPLRPGAGLSWLCAPSYAMDAGSSGFPSTCLRAGQLGGASVVRPRERSVLDDLLPVLAPPVSVVDAHRSRPGADAGAWRAQGAR